MPGESFKQQENCFISVVVCTYNRCEVLPKALESIAASTVPEAAGWEVIVVDNNSNDFTSRVVEEFARRFPGRFRYLFECRQGKSYALNMAIQQARGDVLAFTDDDVIVEPCWLWNLTAKVRNGEWAGTAGRIVPEWSGPMPRWLSPDGPHMSGPFVLFDLGRQPAPMMQAPVGANMAFRRDMFEKYGGFRTDLGRRGKELIGGEDTEFGRRLLAKGERLRYEPEAVVYHPVPQNRLNKKYLLTWAVWHARSEVSVSGIPPANWFIAGVPLFLFRRLGRWTVQWLFSTNPSKRFSNKETVWYLASRIWACFQLSRKGNQEKSGDILRTNGIDAGG